MAGFVSHRCEVIENVQPLCLPWTPTRPLCNLILLGPLRLPWSPFTSARRAALLRPLLTGSLFLNMQTEVKLHRCLCKNRKNAFRKCLMSNIAILLVLFYVLLFQLWFLFTHLLLFMLTIAFLPSSSDGGSVWPIPATKCPGESSYTFVWGTQTFFFYGCALSILLLSGTEL